MLFHTVAALFAARNIQQALRVTTIRVSSAFLIFIIARIVRQGLHTGRSRWRRNRCLLPICRLCLLPTQTGLLLTGYTHLARSYTLRSEEEFSWKKTVYKRAACLMWVQAQGFAAVMEIVGWKVTGLEPDETARANAQRNHQLTLLKLTSHVCDSLQNSTYDTQRYGMFWNMFTSYMWILDRFHNL